MRLSWKGDSIKIKYNDHKIIMGHISQKNASKTTKYRYNKKSILGKHAFILFASLSNRWSVFRSSQVRHAHFGDYMIIKYPVEHQNPVFYEIPRRNCIWQIKRILL